MNLDFVEYIKVEEELLCIIVKAPTYLDRTTFVTPENLNLQVGFVVYKAGEEVPRHYHNEIERTVSSTSEVINVRVGSCNVQIYDDSQNLVADRRLDMGDIVIFVGGGHGFRMNKDTVLSEVKQGPYIGIDEKTNF